MTQTEIDPDDMAARLAADMRSAPARPSYLSSVDHFAIHLAALGWRKAADGGTIQREVEAAALAHVRTCQVGREGSVRYGLRAAVAVADTMAMDATRGPCITKAQEQFAEAAKRVADAIWALRMRVEVTR